MRYQEPKTDRSRRRFERRQEIDAAADVVFPLLCPVREYDWIPEWDCRLVYTESGLAEPGCIFQTDREVDGGIDTWVISRHEPNRHVAFVRINALRAMQYDIRLEPIDGNSTILVWTQVIASLSEAGDRHVEALREEDFANVIAKLETLMNDFLSQPIPAVTGS